MKHRSRPSTSLAARVYVLNQVDNPVSASNDTKHSPMKRAHFDLLTGSWGLEKTPCITPWMRYPAPPPPYQLNPMNINPLRDLVEKSIDFVDRLIRQGKLSADEYRQVRVHVVKNQAELIPLGASSKMNVEWQCLTKLRDLGRETVTRWLDDNFDTIGELSSVDLRQIFQGIGAQHQG